MTAPEKDAMTAEERAQKIARYGHHLPGCRCPLFMSARRHIREAEAASHRAARREAFEEAAKIVDDVSCLQHGWGVCECRDQCAAVLRKRAEEER